MIKAVSGPMRKPTIWFGLSGENVVRLMSDEPILINLQELHPSLPNLQVVLFGGKTEDEIRNQLLGQKIPGIYVQ